AVRLRVAARDPVGVPGHDGGGQGGLAVVDVTDRPDVDVRFAPHKDVFCHHSSKGETPSVFKPTRAAEPGYPARRPKKKLLVGVEPTTSSLPMKCSTTELQQRPSSTAGDGTRTRNI